MENRFSDKMCPRQSLWWCCGGGPSQEISAASLDPPTGSRRSWGNVSRRVSFLRTDPVRTHSQQVFHSVDLEMAPPGDQKKPH